MEPGCSGGDKAKRRSDGECGVKFAEEVFPKTEPDAFTALGFDSANLPAAAIDKAGSIDPGAVQDALASIKEYQGITGLIHHPSGSQVPVTSITIINASRGKQVAIGKYHGVKTPKPLLNPIPKDFRDIRIDIFDMKA